MSCFQHGAFRRRNVIGSIRRSKVLANATSYGIFAEMLRETEPNNVVAPIYPKAMPVILTKLDEIETWLTAPQETALKLQRPLPDGTLRIVAKGGKTTEH